jgi:hypothetical protein
VTPKDSKVKLKKIVNLVLRLIDEDSIDPLKKENIQVSTCYPLGFIEEEICPGIIHEL